MDLDSTMRLHHIALKDYGKDDTSYVEDQITQILPAEGYPRHFQIASVMLEIERPRWKSLVRLDGVTSIHAKHMPVTRAREEEDEFRREEKSEYKKLDDKLQAVKAAKNYLAKRVEQLKAENRALHEASSRISSVEVWTYDKDGGVTNHWVLDSSSGTVPVGNAIVKVNTND